MTRWSENLTPAVSPGAGSHQSDPAPAETRTPAQTGDSNVPLANCNPRQDCVGSGEVPGCTSTSADLWLLSEEPGGRGGPGTQDDDVADERVQDGGRGGELVHRESRRAERLELLDVQR